MCYFKIAFSAASMMVFWSTTFAAAYPEQLFLDTEINTPPKYDFSLDFTLQPELYQASATKPVMCTLGGTMDCMLY